MAKQSSRQKEIGDLFKSSYNTTSTGASTSTENNRSTTQETNASSARQQEIAGLWGNRQIYTQPTTNTANPNTPTTPKTTQTAQPARQHGDINIMAFGAGEYKTTKADEAVNAAIGYGVAAFKKMLSDAARPTGELTIGESALAAAKGISQQEAEKQKREKSKANEWSQRLNESAVDWYESAQENEAKAREGLGDFGNLLVSAGIAGTQMAGDIAMNALVPGSGIFAMAGRAYGSGSLDAQANGLTAGQQQLAGLKSAAIETITEKIFGYGSKVAYGSGLVKSPQVIESAINTLAKTNAGRTALKVLVGANEEGLEEVLSDLLNPLADRLLGLDSGTGNVYEDLQAQQVLEDYLVGGILGLIGGGTQVISGETMRANEEQRASEQAQQDIVSKGLESAEGTHSRILAEEYNKILAESSKRGHRYLYDSEVNSLQTALDMESRQGSTPNANAFNTAQQAKAQQDTAMRMMGARVFGNNDISSNIAKAVAGNAKSSASAQTTRSFTEVTSAISNSTQTTEQAQKLNATAKAVINGNEVSNSQLDALAENNSAMQAIAKYAGVELPTFKGTASEVRTAKRNWLKGISTATAQRIKQAQAQQAEKTAQRQTMPVVDYARKYGEDADKVVQAFSDGESIESNLFNAEFDAAYQLGKSGVDVDKAMAQKSIQDLSPSQRMVAYQMGVKAKSNTEQRKAKVKSKGNVSFDGETYTERGKTKTLPAVNPNGLTQEQKASIEVIKKIAEVTGINFVFYESEANEQGRYTESNGMFKDNTIYLDINAAKQFITDKSAILRTASHELTHYIQKHSPAQYAELKAFISQTLVENESLLGKGKTFDTLVANKAYTRGLSVEEATDEVIADACEMMLRDSKAVQILAEENPTLFKTIRNWLREFCRKLRKAFEGVETAYTESTALLNELGRYTDELQKMWDNAFIDAVRSDFTEMENDAGETVVLADNNGHAQLSVRTYDEGGREQLENYLAKRVKEGAITTAERDDMLSQMEAMYKICKDYAKKYTLFGQWSEAEVRTDPITGEPIFSVVKANGDYALNLDFSLVCKKRRTLDAVFNEMISQGIMDDFDMVERSIAAINDVIRENDFETACSLCFVDTKRYRQAMVADSFVRIYNGLVRSMVKDGQKLSYFNFGEDKTIINPKDGIHTLADSELDFTRIEQFLHNPKYMPKAKKDGGMTTGSVEYRVAKLLKESPQDRKLLKRGDFMSTIGFDNVRQHNTRVLGLYNAKKGAGGPKAAQSDVQYLSEILAQKKFNADSAYKVGGVRVQSFSDYIPRLCFDYVQMMGDLAAKELPAHAYTKEPLFALQFGRTGMKINMSLVPEVIEGGVAPGLDKDGNYAWRDGQSFGSTVYGGSEEFVRKCYDIIGKEYNGQDRLTAQEGYELAMAIQNADGYHNNCGTIAVGVSNAHILKLIRDPNIRMVIPYHKSSLNHLVAVMTNVDKYVNYTLKQNTRLANGTKLESGDFNFNEALRRLGDAKAAADEYLAWCDEHNYIPKFEEFRNEENYYKLLEDFTCYDRDGNAAPQGAVQVNFPTADDAFGSMSDLIEMGLIEDTNLNAKQTAKVPEIVKQIKATLPELEQKWKDEANAKKKPKKVQKSDRDNFSSADGESLQYSVREEAPPKTTKIGYKVFKVRNGQLYPTKVKNPSGQGTPLGVWLNADTGELARDADGNIKTNTLGRISVKADGGTLAWRPGWHLGELPEANQMNKSNPNVEGKPSEVGLMHEDYVFCECEFAADVNYQMEAFQMGFNKNGNYQHKLAGLPYLPKDGYYRYRTNPDPNTSPWFISGAIKITRILDDAERKAIIDKYNAEHPDDPMYYAPRKGGDLSGKAFEKRFGFKAGSVTASDVSGMAKGVDYSDEIRNLAGYAPQKINWDNKAFKEAFAINKTEKSYEDYRKEYEGKAQFSNRDSEYLELAKDPEANREQLQAMVDEAAKKAGYTEQVFHGTGNQFNVFKRNINGIYTTDNEAVAGTYGSRVLRLYGKKGNKVLRIDAHNAPHFSIGKEYIPLDFSDYPLLRGKDNYRTDDITKIANVEGYDVVVITNVYDTSSVIANIEGDGFATDIVYFDPNQIKSADPVTYDDAGNVIPLSERFNASNDDIRYSTRDSEGNELSPQQQEFFKDSKVRDEDGNLLVVYHGTDAEFTVFDRTKGRTNMDIQGMFFSPWELDAGGYGGNVGAYYINITNPASESMGYKALQKFKGQNGAGIKAREYLESLGYDGVNNGNEEYIAFNANQIKLTTNLNPTESEDIRYSERVTTADIAGFDKEAQEIIKNANRRVMYASHPTTMTANRFENAFEDMNGKGYFAFIDPWDFLYLTTNSVEDFLERNPNRLNEGVSEDWGTVNNIQNADSLFLRVEDDGNGNWKVIGHEGRHRMAALYRDGVDRVAVAIRMVGAEKTPQKLKRTYAQFGIGDIYIHDAIPATTEYKDVARKIFASEQGDIRYSFRGENAALKNDNLDVAEQMVTEGYNSEKIRLATGWFKGYDGKWRYEIDDSGAKLDETLPKAKAEGKYEKAKTKLDSDYKAGKIGESLYQLKVHKLLEEYRESINSFKLKDILKHPKLFKAYPQLKEIPISYASLGEGILGQTDGKSMKISRSVSQDEKLSVILHECQHIIQRIEGFARGSNIVEAAIDADDEIRKARAALAPKRTAVYDKAWDTINAYIKKHFPKQYEGKKLYGGNYEGLPRLIERYWYASTAINVKGELDDSGADEVLAEAKKYKRFDAGIFTEIGKLANEYNAIQTQFANVGKEYESPFDRYQRTAGEIEARDVQARIKLSKAERKATRPDIDRDNAIVKYHEDDVQYSERDSDRELLATALESAARTKTEKALIAQYKENLSTLEDRQRTLQQARKELSDARKAKDTARAKSLENTVETLAKSVNAADEKLLKLQATEPLRNVVKRARTEERRAAKVKRDEAVKKTKAQAAAQKKKELDRVREQRDKRIEQVKKHNDEVNRNKRERSNVTAEWHSIAKLGKRFQQLIDHPTQKDSGHAPVGICQSALKLCKCFEIADRKRVIGNVKGAINELKARYASIKDDSALGIFHEQEMYNVIDAVSNEINALDSTEALNAETLHKIVKMLKMLDRTMVNANKFISRSIDKTIAQAGREWAKEINDATPMLKGKIGQFLNWQLRPDTFFKRLSGFAKNSMGEQIQAMFTEGTEKKLKVQQDFYLHFKDLTERKEYLELGKYKGEDLVDVGLVDADGNSIPVTRDMMLAIYKHLSSNDNFMAVAYGGFAVPDLADYYRGKSKSAYDKSVLSDCMDAHMWEVQTEIMRIKAMISATEDEMQKQALKESLAELEIEADLLEREAFNKVQEIYINIQEKLTEYERELLNASTRWMDKSADYINEETMRMYGIEKAKVDNYWTIHRDTNFINTDLRTAVNDINLENWGSLKERVQSHAPVLLTGFAFELDNHTRRMSDFVGYAAVQRDFSKLYNTKLPAMRSSLARIVQQKFGSDNWLFGQSGQSYIDEYISAVSGSVKNGDALSNLYGNLAQATLSLNLRVAVSQLASIPTAAAEVGWGNVARGLGEGFKIAFSKTAKEELAAKDPWYFQRYRGEGGMVEIASMKDASNFIGRQWNKLARSKVGSKLVNWCQDFDAFATSMMWAMAEEQVKENGGKPGDSNYDRLVSNVYRDIIRKTQPNYTVTERSGLLRDKRGGMKFLTMYKTQSNQNLNILYEASATLRKYKQDFANGKNGVTKADIKEAQKAVAQGYTAVLIGGTLAFSILRFLANAIMHSLDNYRDDEDDLTLMSVLGGITKETVSATAGMVAFGGQVYDFVLPLIEDGRYYGLSDSAFAALSNVLEDGYRLITKDDRDFEDFYKVFKDISNVLGLPTNNVRKLVNGARYHIEDIINGEFLSYEAGVERSQAVMAGKILDAVRAGDTDTADELFADAVESSSAQEPEKAVKSKVKSALKDAYNAGEIDDAEAQKILQDYFGYDKNAAYFEMKKFSEDVSSTYSPLYDALESGNRSDIRKEINDLLDHGKEEKDIKQSVTGHYREAYRNGSNEERMAIRKAMYASGLWDSSDEIIALCNKWLESK